MQVCKAGLSRMRKIWLTRHGQSMSNVHELLGGDSHLSPRGAVYAKKLPDVLIDRVPLVPFLRTNSISRTPRLWRNSCMPPHSSLR